MIASLTALIVNKSSINLILGLNAKPKAAKVWSILPPDHPIIVTLVAPFSKAKSTAFSRSVFCMFLLETIHYSNLFDALSDIESKSTIT